MTSSRPPPPSSEEDPSSEMLNQHGVLKIAQITLIRALGTLADYVHEVPSVGIH